MVDDNEKGKGERREGACVPELVENDFSFLR
jgi:hypothetical protein